MTKSMTLRLPSEKAAELEAVARVEERPMSEMAREAIDRLIDERRADKAFQARVKKLLEEDREILERLAR